MTQTNDILSFVLIISAVCVWLALSAIAKRHKGKRRFRRFDFSGPDRPA